MATTFRDRLTALRLPELLVCRDAMQQGERLAQSAAGRAYYAERLVDLRAEFTRRQIDFEAPRRALSVFDRGGRTTEADRAAIRSLLDGGLSLREVARRTGWSHRTVSRVRDTR